MGAAYFESKLIDYDGLVIGVVDVYGWIGNNVRNWAFNLLNNLRCTIKQENLEVCG